MALVKLSKSTLHVSRRILLIAIGVCAVILGVLMPRWFGSVGGGVTNLSESFRGIAYADVPDPEPPDPEPLNREERSCDNGDMSGIGDIDGSSTGY